MSDEPVGIDIELIKPVNIKIAERFFAPDETAYIKDGEQEQRFYEVWTKKESHIKWEGKGLYKPLTSFNIFDSHIHNAYYYKIFGNKDAVAHVCTTQSTPPSIKNVRYCDFFTEYKLIDKSLCYTTVKNLFSLSIKTLV